MGGGDSPPDFERERHLVERMRRVCDEAATGREGVSFEELHSEYAQAQRSLDLLLASKQRENKLGQHVGRLLRTVSGPAQDASDKVGTELDTLGAHVRSAMEAYKELETSAMAALWRVESLLVQVAAPELFQQLGMLLEEGGQGPRDALRLLAERTGSLATLAEGLSTAQAASADRIKRLQGEAAHLAARCDVLHTAQASTLDTGTIVGAGAAVSLACVAAARVASTRIPLLTVPLALMAVAGVGAGAGAAGMTMSAANDLETCKAKARRLASVLGDIIGLMQSRASAFLCLNDDLTSVAVQAVTITSIPANGSPESRAATATALAHLREALASVPTRCKHMSRHSAFSALADL
eukprot:jgi/Mesvir1/28182/Mv04739-RA.1